MKKEVVGEVHQVELLFGSCYCGVEPSEVVGCEHILREIALLNEDCVPIASLCLVAGECVGELDLQGVLVFVLFYHLSYYCFVRRVLTIVVVEAVVEGALFVFGQ